MENATNLSALIDRLARIDPGQFPFVSLYLNTQPNDRGRDHYQAFTRSELGERAELYVDDAASRESLRHDLGRIQNWLDTELRPSANGAAIFACSGAGLFEAVQVAAPIDRHMLFVSDRPHLYPLARLDARYPRYAALVSDTNRARVFVFATGTTKRVDEVTGEKTRSHDMGGWSQARFQRRTANLQKTHVQEAVEALERIVRAEDIPRVIVTGNEVSLPLIEDRLTPLLRDRLVDVFRLEARAPEHEVLERTLEALWRKDAETDKEKVDAVIGAYRGGGLAVVGPESARRALENGQVDELVVSASLVRPEGSGAEGIEQVLRADDLVAKARQTDAEVTFIEDPALLEPVGGVAATLRYRSAYQAEHAVVQSRDRSS
jgi:peptide subunit release factor 1 (eRF1)